MTLLIKTTAKPLKAKLATLVSTIGLTLALAAPTASSAASVDSICFNMGNLVYSMVNIGDEQAVVNYLEERKKDNIATATNMKYTLRFNEFMSEMVYFALNRKGTFEGDDLKRIIRIKCPSVYHSTKGG